MAAAGPSPTPTLQTRRARRTRQRSVRVTLSVALLVAATLLVLAALPTRQVTWLAPASVAALVLAWASVRMMWTEVLQSRRFNAADRAAAAKAYRSLWTTRVAEHAEFTTEMTERLAEAHLSRRELQGEVAQRQQALDDAQQRVQMLETELAVREAEAADTLASWEEESRPRRPRLVKEA